MYVNLHHKTVNLHRKKEFVSQHFERIKRRKGRRFFARTSVKYENGNLRGQTLVARIPLRFCTASTRG